MSLALLQELIPAGITITNLLNDGQKKWLSDNVNHLPLFLHSHEGQRAMLTLLDEFEEFVMKPHQAA